VARQALLIGVSRFDDQRLSALNAPPQDITALADVLRDPARGGFEEVALSLDDDFLTVRDKLAALFEARDPDDTVLLYYSGHGVLRIRDTVCCAAAIDCSWRRQRPISTGRRHVASPLRKSAIGWTNAAPSGRS
jgi:chaperonin GroEL